MLEVIDLYKIYEGQALLKGVSFEVQPAETVCLLGASGSGKSTILRIIAGLETAERGEVRWQARSLAGVPAHERNFGLMFQDYALFPHLNVFENVAFGLRMQNWALKEINLRVGAVLRQANLKDFEQRRVTELSGGEQQRVALARALAPRPGLLMLDEPLGALDRALREQLLGGLRDVLHRSGMPAIYVTHDQQEAFSIADQLILLNEGLVVQSGPPADVFAKPASAWVASFLGLGNVLKGVQTSEGVQTPQGLFVPDGPPAALGKKVQLLLRPMAEIVSEAETLSGKVADVVFLGQGFRVELENGLYFSMPSAPQVGELLKLKLQKVERV